MPGVRVRDGTAARGVLEWGRRGKNGSFTRGGIFGIMGVDFGFVQEFPEVGGTKGGGTPNKDLEGLGSGNC